MRPDRKVVVVPPHEHQSSSRTPGSMDLPGAGAALPTLCLHSRPAGGISVRMPVKFRRCFAASRAASKSTAAQPASASRTMNRPVVIHKVQRRKVIDLAPTSKYQEREFVVAFVPFFSSSRIRRALASPPTSRSAVIRPPRELGCARPSPEVPRWCTENPSTDWLRLAASTSPGRPRRSSLRLPAVESMCSVALSTQPGRPRHQRSLRPESESQSHHPAAQRYRNRKRLIAGTISARRLK